MEAENDRIEEENEKQLALNKYTTEGAIYGGRSGDEEQCFEERANIRNGELMLKTGAAAVSPPLTVAIITSNGTALGSGEEKLLGSANCLRSNSTDNAPCHHHHHHHGIFHHRNEVDDDDDRIPQLVIHANKGSFLAVVLYFKIFT